MPRILADLTPLRVSPAFRRIWLGSVAAALGGGLTTVAVGLQVYALTHSSFAVGLVGLFALVPLVALGLYGGSIVDAYDRRTILLITQSGFGVVAAVLATLAWLELATVPVLYGLVAVQNGFFAVNSPAQTAVVPRLIPARLLPAANALSSLSFGVSLAVGPVLAGVIVATAGYGWAYSVEVVLVVVALACLVGVPALPPEGEVRRAGLASVLEGLAYLRSRRNVRMTFLVDLAAMVLAMPVALFPAIGAVLIGGGERTAGYLVGGIAVGTFLAGLLSGPYGRVRRQGRAIAVSVVCWGLAVAAFGAVVLAAPGAGPGDPAHWLLWPAIGCMVLAGAADTVSAVFRRTILQAAAPDEMRGRLQGVFIVVVAGGPKLGGIVLGALAVQVTEGAAALFGGLACVVVVVGLVAWQRGFLAYDARHPTP